MWQREGEVERNRKREWGQGEKQNNRDTENILPLHGFCWFSSSGLLSWEGPSLVKIMVTVLSHKGCEKPVKHKIHRVYIYSGSDGNAQVPPLGREFYTGWCNTLDHWTLHESDGFWHLLRLRHLSCLFYQWNWVNYGPPEGVNSFRLYVNVLVLLWKGISTAMPLL